MSDNQNDERENAPDLLRDIQGIWLRVQECCEYRNPERDHEGQGKICENDENRSGMEWCDLGYCPLLVHD